MAGELLRPPPHRAPLIAAGGVLLTLGIVLEEFRLEEELAVGWHLVICGLVSALLLAIAAQWATEGGRPLASQSVLVVCGLILLLFALLHLSDVLGADAEQLSSGRLVWTLLLFGAVALWFSTRKRSSIAGLFSALAFGGALLAAWDWIFDPLSVTPFRWLLLLLAVVYVLVSLALRGSSPRHSEQLVNAAGVAILGISGLVVVSALFGFFFGGSPGAPLPGFWEFVVLAAGCGLIAYGAVDRVPGAAYLGVANLVGFTLVVTVVSDETLEWWPLTLLLLGGGALAAGMRPRRPLPPEPRPYATGDLPLAARSDGETVVNVRHQ